VRLNTKTIDERVKQPESLLKELKKEMQVLREKAAKVEG